MAASDRERWNARYRSGDHTTLAPLPFLAEMLGRLPSPPANALDLAAGAGRHALLLANQGWKVTAVDCSRAALDLIAAQNPTIELVEADLEDPAFEIEPGRWDLICITFYLQRSLFDRIRAGVRPGGYVAAAFPIEAPMNPLYLMKPGELASLFADFEILHSAETHTAELFARRRHDS